jgi:uncharacterized protein
MKHSLLLFLLSIAAYGQAELTRKATAGISLGIANGELVIAQVRMDGNAQRDGLIAGDVILRVNGADARPEGAFARSISRRNAGERVEWVVRREGREVHVMVEYRAAPMETAPGLDVLYRSVETDGHLRRTLVTVPKHNGRKPAVLWIAGSGCGSQEAPNGEGQVTQFLYELTRRGYVTMRVEKTGVGDSEGPPCYSDEGSMSQEVRGYAAGLRALRTYDFVDANQIYLFGHSAGATLAPLVAKGQNLKAIAVAGAMGTNFMDYLVSMRRREFELSAAKPEEITITQRCLTRLLKDRRSPDQVEQEMPDCKQRVRFDSPPPYIQEWADLNLANAWNQAPRVPVLVLYGSGDFVTNEAESRALVRTISSKANLRVVPMDHEFQTFATQHDAWTAEQKHSTAPLYPKLAEIVDRFFKEH